MRIKVCGLHPIRDVQLCIDLGINFLGFVFYDKSPRNLNLELVKKLKKYDKLNSYFTAVTVNPTDEFIKNVAFENFDYIQLQQNAFCVISDSGTISEESSILSFPAIMIRKAHERPECMDEGTLIMSGLKSERIIESIEVVTKQHKIKTPQIPRRKFKYYNV